MPLLDGKRRHSFSIDWSLYFQCAFETELASVSVTAKQLESQPTTGSDWTVFHASLRLLQAIGKTRSIFLYSKCLDVFRGNDFVASRTPPFVNFWRPTWGAL